MTNKSAVALMAKQTDEPAWREHRVISGSVVVDPAFVARMGRAAYLDRLVYNAAIDDRVPFIDGFTYRYRLAESRRTGTPEPSEPAKSDRFLPVPTSYGIGPDLTRLRATFPALAEFPRSMQENAVAEACRARAAHVKACAKAK